MIAKPKTPQLKLCEEGLRRYENYCKLVDERGSEQVASRTAYFYWLSHKYECSVCTGLKYKHDFLE